MAVITKGRQIQDRDSIGGIKAVFIVVDTAATVANSAILFSDANASRTVNEITDLAAPAGSDTYKALQFDILRGAGGFTQTVEGSIENGTFSYSMSLEFTLHKIDEATQDLIDQLAKTRATLFVHDNNDNLIVAGYGNGMELIGGAFSTGSGFGELNGTTMTFEGRELRPAPFVAATAGVGTTDYPFDGLATAGNTPTPVFTV